MIANVILGINIDTPMWIKGLHSDLADHIIVLDYDYFEEPQIKNKVMYLSPIDLKAHLKSFDSVRFYKSMYIYPGMRH